MSNQEVDIRSYVAVLLAAALALVQAQATYDKTWQTNDPVGMTDVLYVLGIANTDADPQPELIYRGTEPEFQNIYYIWALDLASGEVEQVTDEFYRILIGPGMEPRLVDVDGDARSEILLLAEEGPNEGAYWFLYSYTSPGATAEPGYRRLPGLGLSPGRPNPVSKRTVIDYSLPAPADVRLQVFDASGRLVRDLSPGQQPAGSHRATWAADDQSGKEAPAGSYFYVLETDGKTLTRSAVKLD